ncbi:MAG TPA: 6-carboxytetrahydropterin synthase [Longimicrobiales bacterium]|nr:6-carboxytetrahydropterin synthase [Longimicrobiales bacterium]
MAIAQLTRKVRFSAAHRYHRPEWDDARNRAVFGACANPHGHGHNYLLEATFEGEVDARTGFAVDLGALDALLEREVRVPLDHRHLNHDVEAFGEGGLVPTSENLLVWLWPRLAEGGQAGGRLVRLRLHEDDTFFVDYRGPDAMGQRP